MGGGGVDLPFIVLRILKEHFIIVIIYNAFIHTDLGKVPCHLPHDPAPQPGSPGDSGLVYRQALSRQLPGGLCCGYRAPPNSIPNQ